jgi:hypothetical protein
MTSGSSSTSGVKCIGISAVVIGAIPPVLRTVELIGKPTTSGNTFAMTAWSLFSRYQGYGLTSITTIISYPSRSAHMASSSNSSCTRRHIMVSMMDPDIQSRMLLVDFAELNIPNATIAANEMQDFIAIVI